ncbi:hypothetical protein PSM7751_01150 [Pseudooceanicola marinus]|uniref:Uncharacterized protein n=1 Tax=Pseudooceanicola marinus TaxID=396013 RepID=A0A1X6YR25_9RHOB|nr:hypothetical protein [Pseudooceanicola marinus]PJE26520.1 hypothetical protein CVM50_19170 [Pseudooceanicola marinus]SLN28779.1 hypothetical protein PSM7751_01150 [Pseudooceanicola marinus]
MSARTHMTSRRTDRCPLVHLTLEGLCWLAVALLIAAALLDLPTTIARRALQPEATVGGQP